MLGVLDLQAADGPPSGRDPGQQLGPEADLRVGHGVQEAGPGQQPVQHGDPVLMALVLAISRAVESSIGSVISTRPESGTRPRTGRPTARAANDAYDRAGSTRQLPTASRGYPPGGN